MWPPCERSLPLLSHSLASGCSHSSPFPLPAGKDGARHEQQAYVRGGGGGDGRGRRQRVREEAEGGGPPEEVRHRHAGVPRGGPALDSEGQWEGGEKVLFRLSLNWQ